MHVSALIAAGGMGHRLGAGKPKGLVRLGDQQLVGRAVSAMVDSGVVEQIVVAVPAGTETEVEIPQAQVPVTICIGGVLRQDSVRIMLAAVAASTTHVLVHDAARALAPPDLVRRVVSALADGPDAVIPVLPVVDTVAYVDAAGNFVRNVPRAELRLVQTPQGFSRSALSHAHAAADPDWEATDDASMVAAVGGRVQTIPGDPAALKITTAADVHIAATFLANR
jgi:2-C-methyl-D-erythritol 4-phosphate cytidylyltransferase